MKNKNTNGKVKSLRAKLVEIVRGLGPVEKSKRNPHFGYNYVSQEQLNALLAPKLAEQNILFVPSVTACDVHYGDGKAGVFAKVMVECTFHDCDSDETLTVGGAGMGWDSGDKGVPKAITGAVKSVLLKCFMVSDESDPEAGDQAPAPPAKTAHTRTKPYEEETAEGDQKATTDLLEIKSFLTENKIPESFLLTLLQEKKLIDGHVKFVASINPGILRRVLSDKSKATLLKAWAAQKADEETGGQTAPDLSPPAEVRTNEGDQTRGRRPVMSDIAPADYLEQEGYKDWRKVRIHFGKQKGEPLGKITSKSLSWWISNWQPKQYPKGVWQDDVILLDMALCVASAELGEE